MSTKENLEEAIELLQQLGLKEYEARCFVGLSRLETGTAKQLSEMTEVPRTRVYDAIRVLEAQGLVEIHHSSPQRFRAVSISEATETLRDQYEARVERLQSALNTIEVVETDDESPVQQVWSMVGQEAIENRTNGLITDANDEVVLVLGDQSLLTSALVDTLNAVEDDIELIVGALRGAAPEADPGRRTERDDVRLRAGVAAGRERYPGRDRYRPAAHGRSVDASREFDHAREQGGAGYFW